MDLNNANIGGFVFANDYYSLNPSIQNKYESYIIFDVSTDEILVNNHSFGFSKNAKKEIINDERVIAEAFLLLNSSFIKLKNDINNFSNINTSINIINSSLDNLITSNNNIVNLINDVSSDILNIIENDELLLATALTQFDTSIININTTLDSILLNINELQNNFTEDISQLNNELDEFETVLIHYLDKVDTSIYLLQSFNQNLTTQLSNIIESINSLNASVNMLENT